MSGTFGSKPALTAPKYHFRYPRLNATSLPIADGHQSGWQVQIVFVLMSVENIGLIWNGDRIANGTGEPI
jgi:hypothetical protein